MAAETDTPREPVRFETHPDRYVHWRLDFPAEYAGAVARIGSDGQPLSWL